MLPACPTDTDRLRLGIPRDPGMSCQRSTALGLGCLVSASLAGACLSISLGATPTSQSQSSLDFATYRTSIEPIFLKKRENGVRCYDCHSTLATRLKLVPLAPGDSAWTEEQSRLNFQVVSRLVVAGDPAKSRLLLHPLAVEAGGDPDHTGGKFWTSRSDPEWQMLAAWVRGNDKAHSSAEPKPQPMAHDSLDFQFFKTKVEPVFLKDRPGHARCYGCHSLSSRIFRLQTLSVGQTTWTEEQSRSNFENALNQVVPGDPYSSALLFHPLAPEAGGDIFHSGGRQFATQNDPDWLAMADWVRGARSETSIDNKPRSGVQIYVTNSAGNTIDVIDAATNKVVQVIRGIELPHGVNFSPDGARVYVSNESESVLDVVDRKTCAIVSKVALSGRPNNIAVTKDGRRVLVGIRSESNPGVVDVIDTTSLQRVKSIPVYGSVHNIYVTSDGKYAVSGSIENKAATIIDLETEKAVAEVKFDRGVRPMAFESNADGSTARMFVQLSGVHGFAVVDFAKRAEIARITLPDKPGGYSMAESRVSTPSHGIGVAPDGKSLWVNSTPANAVFRYSLPDLNLVGYVALPEVHPVGRPPSSSVPEWITFTPDSAVVYVSNSGAASVSAIDARAMKRIAEIPVGEVPKRIASMAVP